MGKLCPFRKAPAVGALYVTAYGAVGDGETDDTEAIQDAIDAAAIVGGNVLLPAGTYKVVPLDGDDHAVSLKSNVKVYGAGIGNTIITVPNPVAAKQVFYGYGADGAELAKMTITTPESGPS